MLHTLFAGDPQLGLLRAVRFTPAGITRVMVEGNDTSIVSLNDTGHL